MWKQTRLLLPHLENFKSPSEIKTGQNSARCSAMETGGIFCCWHGTSGRVYSHSLLVCLKEKNKNRGLDLIDLSSSLKRSAMMNVYVNENMCSSKGGS